MKEIEIEIEQFIVDKINEILETDKPVNDKSKPFDSLGIDSVNAVRMVGELEEYIDMELPTTLLWEYNTIHKLTEYLSEKMSNQQ